MIKMIFKKVWKQRRGNAWLIAESFIVLIFFWTLFDVLLQIALPILDCPKGYSVENVYSLELNKDNSIDTDESTDESIKKIIQQIEGHPAIEAVTVYSGSEHFESSAALHLIMDSIGLQPSCFSTDENYFDVFRVEIKKDGGIFPWKPENGRLKIILTQSASMPFFGNKDAMGKFIESKDSVSYLISGLVEETAHLQYGSEDEYCYTTLSEDYKYNLYTHIAFRIKDEIGYKQFENKDMEDFKKLLSVGAIYPESVLSFEQIKRDVFYNDGDMSAVIMMIAGLLFFIANLFISMFAIFYFRINKRTGEIGLKLSVGATHQIVMKELILEGVLILTLAAIPAVIIIMNLYYLELFWIAQMPITFLRAFGCIISTYVVLALMVVLATWLPARRVMKIEPAIALKEE